MRKHRFQRVPDAAQKILEIRAKRLLRRAQLECQQSTRRKAITHRAKELRRVEPVQLRRLGVWHIHNDYVESAVCVLEIPPAIRVVDVYANVRKNGGLDGKELVHHLDERGVQLNICLLYTSPSPRDRQKSRMPS